MCRYFAIEKQIPPEWVEEFKAWNDEEYGCHGRYEDRLFSLKKAIFRDDIPETSPEQMISFGTPPAKPAPATPKPKRKYTRRAKAEGKSPHPLKIKGEVKKHGGWPKGKKRGEKPTGKTVRSTDEADRYIREQEKLAREKAGANP